MSLTMRHHRSPVQAWAGEYDQRVTIKQKSTTVNPNEDGQIPETAATYATRWASVYPASMRGNDEKFVALQTRADVTHQVRMRSDDLTRAITPKMWILLADDTRLDIKLVIDVDLRRVEILMYCNEQK